jgi:hypothetical protein
VGLRALGVSLPTNPIDWAAVYPISDQQCVGGNVDMHVSIFCHILGYMLGN